MNGRYGKLLLGSLLFVSGPCWAGESLINGEQLQYNYIYRCAGERVIVGHCYDNDDNSMCQTYYPDRPKYHGYEIMKAEKRGDVVARLEACNRPPSAAEIAAATERLKTTFGAPAPDRPAIANGPPGLGDAKWSMLDMDDKSAVYFTAAKVRPAGSTGSGWFTTVFIEPRDLPNGLAGTEFVQSDMEADCSKRLLKMRGIAGFDEEGKLLGGGPDVAAKWTPFPAGTVWEKEYNLLCGKPQPLLTKAPISGDHETIEMNYYSMMKERMHEQLMKSAH